MDDAAPRSRPTQESSTHLWIPAPDSSESTSEQKPSSSRTPQLVRERLYVGNLGPAVDEYTLLQVFTKFGKIAKLDFLFHKSGPNKGKPRGYAFVEYANEADAAKALQAADGRLLRGRKLVVTLAQQAPSHDSGSTAYAGRVKRTDTTPTALSLAKSSGIARPEAKTSSKIAVMEAKLRQMANSSPYSERPALPDKPAGSRSSEGVRSHRTGGHGSRSMSGKTQGTKSDTDGGGEIGHARLTALPSIRDAESSDLMRNLPASKQRSIPGVKILKGGSNKGTSGVTPSA